MLDKLKSLFGARVKSAAADPPVVPSPADGLIGAYDSYGREVRVPREEWLKKVLQPNLRSHWDDATALYNLIISALDDGFGSELLEASARLLQLDRATMPERGFVVRGIVLLANRRLQEASDILEEGLATVGRTAALLTNRAKVHAQAGEKSAADATLWEAVQRDPNLENGLGWWLAIERERHGEEGYVAALERACGLAGSWLPQLWLARDHLQHGRLEEALSLYRPVLAGGEASGRGLMMVSGDLGNHGHSGLIPDLIGKLYEPARDDPKAGLNLLQAYLELGRWQEGEALVHRIYELQLSPLQSHLDRFASAFGEMKKKSEVPLALPAEELSITTISITQPIWAYSLKEPAWLLKAKPANAPVVAILALSNIRPEATRAERQSEDDVGRLTRAIPLYLAEAVHAWTSLAGHVLVQIAQGEAPVVFGAEMDPAEVAAGLPADVRWLVVGSIAGQGDALTLKLRLWDRTQGRQVESIERTASASTIGGAVSSMEQALLRQLGASSAQPWDAFYRRPAPEALPAYLSALGQSFVLTLVANGIGSKETLWGERALIEWPLTMALQWPGLESCNIMYAANLAKARLYDSTVLVEFQRKSIEFMRDLHRRGSPAAPLWPLVWHAVGADPNGPDALPLPEATPGYEVWLRGISPA